MDLLFILGLILCVAVSVASMIVAAHALRRPPAPVVRRTVAGERGGCRKDQHQWADEPRLVSDDMYVYQCDRGCHSELRHRTNG